MRDALGIDKSVDVLDYVHSLPEKEQEEAHVKLQQIERTAMVDMEATPGVNELLKFIDSYEPAIPRAILTRNFPIPVKHLVDNVLGGHAKEFTPIITREFKPPKPSPAGIFEIAKQWNIKPENLVMVGDSIDDMMAGRRAGAGTILIQTDVNDHVRNAYETDVTVSDLTDVIDVLKNGFESKVGGENAS